MKKFRRIYRASRLYRESLTEDSFHDSLIRSQLVGSGLHGSLREECCAIRWDTDWIDMFETTLPFVEKAVEEQRRFLESFSEIRRVDQAQKTTVESVRHLAEHSNLITHMDGRDIVPDKILIVQREDNYAIYENRFLYTLVSRMRDFLHLRYDEAARFAGLRRLVLHAEQNGNSRNLRVQCVSSLTLEQLPQEMPLPEDEAEGLNDTERVEMLIRRTHQLSATPLLHQLNGCTPVTVPIIRTNVFKNNENFRQALNLFDFLQQYEKSGYEVLTDSRPSESLPDSLRQHLAEELSLQAMLGSFVLDPDLEETLAEDLRLSLEEERLAAVREDAARTHAARALADQARQEEITVRHHEIELRDRKIAQLEQELKEARQTIATLRKTE